MSNMSRHMEGNVADQYAHAHNNHGNTGVSK